MKVVIQEDATEIKRLINEQIVDIMREPFALAAGFTLQAFKPFFISLFLKYLFCEVSPK